MLQEVQQQGTSEAKERSGRTGSQEGRGARPAPTPLQASINVASKEIQPLASPKLCTTAQTSSIRPSSRPRSSTHAARNGVEATCIDASRLYITPSKDAIAWRLSGEAGSPREYSDCDYETRSSLGTTQDVSKSTMIQLGSFSSDASTPATSSTAKSTQSRASSLAYFVKSRRLNSRLFKRRTALPILSRKPEPVKLPLEHTQLVRQSPRIVEDSRDYMYPRTYLQTGISSPSLELPSRPDIARSFPSSSSTLAAQPCPRSQQWLQYSPDTRMPGDLSPVTSCCSSSQIAIHSQSASVREIAATQFVAHQVTTHQMMLLTRSDPMLASGCQPLLSLVKDPAVTLQCQEISAGISMPLENTHGEIPCSPSTPAYDLVGLTSNLPSSKVAASVQSSEEQQTVAANDKRQSDRRRRWRACLEHTSRRRWRLSQLVTALRPGQHHSTSTA